MSSSTITEHPVERFWRRLPEVLPPEAHPPQLKPIGEMRTDRTAGFPASHGLHQPDPDSEVLPAFPYGGLMLVGHHLRDSDTFRSPLGEGRFHRDPEQPSALYWRHVYEMLDRTRIPRTAFFATNAHPALLAERYSEGMIPRRGTEQWRAAAADFLLEQIEVMDPAVIVLLGTGVAEFVRNDLGVTLQENRICAVRLGEVESCVVAISHPSAAISGEQRRGQWGVVAEAWRHSH